MWRAFFLALGISLCILGGECMIVDEAVVSKTPAPPAATHSYGPSLMSGQPTHSKTIRTPEWAPWTCLSAGVVIILYSFSIPQRMSA